MAPAVTYSLTAGSHTLVKSENMKHSKGTFQVFDFHSYFLHKSRQQFRLCAAGKRGTEGRCVDEAESRNIMEAQL